MPEQMNARPVGDDQAGREPAADQSASSVEVYETGAPVASVDDARRLTERIKSAVASITGQLDELAALVAEAQATQVHVAMGYKSWTAYVSAEFGANPLRLDRQDRQEVVASLSEAGMSARAIAPVVHTSTATVKRDVARGSHEPRAAAVTGLDGKRYKRTPAQAASSRPPRAPLLQHLIDTNKMDQAIASLVHDVRAGALDGMKEPAKREASNQLFHWACDLIYASGMVDPDRCDSMEEATDHAHFLLEGGLDR